ncbi:MAG: hypothetical protein Q8O24_08780 [Gallionellaceae bacterium]|nr:hypothetical protein [Gallionellaceae bacterium]
MTSQQHEVGRNRFRNMIENFNDKPLEEITNHLDSLGISTSFIAGAAAVAKYCDKVLPACPSAAKVIAVILVFVGLFLIVWVGFGAWVGMAKLEPGRIRSHLGGALFFLIAILVGIGGMFAAISA